MVDFDYDVLLDLCLFLVVLLRIFDVNFGWDFGLTGGFLLR